MKKPLLASLVVLAALVLTGCGTSDERISDPVWSTVRDEMTGLEFRCIYVRAGYSGGPWCYEVQP